MNHHHSGLQQLLYEMWCDEGEWEAKEATDKERLNSAFHRLKLDNTDIFDGWKDFDERTDVS